jgi:hypothetical protein
MNPGAPAPPAGPEPVPAPFVERTLACPVCGRVEAHRDIRAQAYVEESWDSDHRVSRYRWVNPAFSVVQPPFYAVWHCPACLYSDLKEAFQRPPVRPERFVRLRLMFLRRLRDQDLVLFTLGSGLGGKERTFASALAAHLMAIYIQEMPTEADQDQHKLARLSLRTAWLYRDPPAPAVPADRAQVEAVRGLARLEGALRVIAEFVAEPGGEHLPLADLRRDLHKFLARIRAIEESWGDGGLPARPAEEPAEEPAALLGRVAEQWPGVPRTEAQCLLRAVTAYQRYYEGNDGPGGSALGVLDLIVDLHRRLGAWDQVLRGAGELARRAGEQRREFQQTLLGKPDLTETERRRTRAKLESLADLLDRAKALSDEAERLVSRESARRPLPDRPR